jgi:hypothetical protein
MSDRGSVALKNVRAAEGLVEMIQTTRDFRSDLGGGGWSILWRNEDADRWGSFTRKNSGFKKNKRPTSVVESYKTTYGHKAVVLMSVVEGRAENICST